MPRPLARAAGLLLLALAPVAGSVPAQADMGAPFEVPAQEFPPWSFTGPLGRFDRNELRRGFQVFSETCAACHSLQHVAYRDLGALGVGFGPEDIKAIAAGYKVPDGPDENGRMFMRPARPADFFALPYPNKEAARAANKGMYPPDLSLITRARKGGADHVYAFLTGYGSPPPDVALNPGMYYNAAAPGRQTGMQGVLVDGAVSYDDGTEATVARMSRDVTAFLAWAADPHMEARKLLGLKVVIFLVLLTVMFIALKLEVWAPLHDPPAGRRPTEDCGPAVAR